MLGNLIELFSHYWQLWVFVIVLSVLVFNYCLTKVLNRWAKHAIETTNIWDDVLIFSVRKPVRIAVWVFGINFAALIVARSTGTDWFEIIQSINRVGLIILIVWCLWSFINGINTRLCSEHYMEKPMDPTTARVVSKLIQVAIIITGGLIIMQALGYSISGVLAFGGVGGIAIGFAARDLLANFFGALMIYLDKPFKIGDWIRSPDKEIEGVVEDIGWRSTCIRTFDKRLLYVPNSAFNQISLENPSRMSHRRIYETIGLRYADMSKMPVIVATVKDMLQQHPEIDQSQTMIVNFNQFNASSVDFFIYVFTRTTNWIHFHHVKEQVLLTIAGIINSHDAEIAFPTTTVHLQETSPEPDVNFDASDRIGTSSMETSN